MHCRAQQASQPVLNWINPIVKYGEMTVTVKDQASQRKCNKHELGPGPEIRSIQSDQCDNFNIKLHNDGSSIVGSPLRSPLLSNGDDDEKLLATQQCSQVHLPTENLSPSTVAPFSQTCLAGNVSIAPSSQHLQTSGKMSAAPSGGQLVGSIRTSRKRKFSGMVHSANDVVTYMESDSSTLSADLSSSDLSDTSSQCDNFSPLSDSALTVNVKQSTSKTVRQPQVCISDPVCNSLIAQQEGSTSDNLTLDNALEDSIPPYIHTRVPGNVSTAQLGRSGKLSRAPSGGQLVGSVFTSRERKFSGVVHSASDVVTHMESDSSTLSADLSSSDLSDTSSQCDNFTPLSDSAVTVIVQQSTSKTVRQPQVCISDPVCNSLIAQQEGSTSDNLTLDNALEDTMAPYIDTTVPGNVSTAQLGRSGKLSRAPSGGQLVGSVSTRRKRKFWETAQAADNVGSQMDAVSSCGLSMKSSKNSGTSSQYKKFSSLINYAIGVMVEQQTSNIVRQPSTGQQEASAAQSITHVNGVENQASLCSPLLQKMFQDRLKPSEKKHASRKEIISTSPVSKVRQNIISNS
jgi:hypothetical protein